MRTVHTLLWAAVGFCLLDIVVLSRPAHAQQAICGSAEAVKATFAKTYGEVVIMTAHVAKDVDVIVLRSDAGTWTILRTMGQMACAIAAGRTSEVDHGI